MVDTFRKEYKPQTDVQIQQVLGIKNKAQELWTLFDTNTSPTSAREIAVAKTRLEEAVMWAVKGITG